MSLTQLPNIGKTLAEKLQTIGVNSAEELCSMGAENAIIKIETLESGSTCINMLYALEGAIQGIRWHGLDSNKKKELKMFFDQMKKQI